MYSWYTIPRFILIPGICNNVLDFNEIYLIITETLLYQWYYFHKLLKTFIINLKVVCTYIIQVADNEKI